MIPLAPAPVLIPWFAPFASAFTAPTLRGVLVLVAGAILAPGRRTVTSALSILGLREIATFTTFHRVLNRNRWSPRDLACRLLHQLIAIFVPTGPVVIAIDETIERRWGARIRARGIYRDPVRSSHGHFVKTHAPGADPLRQSRVGAAVPDRPGAVGTLCVREGTSA
jgi:hypothetical protein